MTLGRRRAANPCLLLALLLVAGCGRASTPAGPTTTASSVPTAAPTTSLVPPIRAAFYYPWFPGAWTQRGVYPYTNYSPEPLRDGEERYYDSGDPVIVARHIEAMRYGGMAAGIASWWGRGSREDVVIPTLLRAAQGTDFRWALYYEQEGNAANGAGPVPSTDHVRADLEYMAARYFGHPNYLRVGGRPVVFAYGEGGDGCEMATRWAAANRLPGGARAYVSLKVTTGYRRCPDQPDSWHQYAPANATDRQPGYSFAISPGFWLQGEAERLPRDAERFRRTVREMTASGEPWQLVTTFNEWGEGTSVESAAEWESPSGYGVYLDALHEELGAPSG